MHKNITRREFLRTTSLAGATVLLSGCQSMSPSPAIQPENTPTSELMATKPFTPTITPTSTPTPAYQASVAIDRVNNYDQALIKQSLESMFTSLGGIADIVKPGARVGIKVNLTGGTWWDTPDKPPATEYFVTHPAVAAALSEILLDLGASQIMIMDGLGDEAIFRSWGYSDMAKRVGVQLVDLCQTTPYIGFNIFPVGENALIYPQFSLHPSLGEVDVFISLAKLKVHSTTGVTLTLKNLIGIAPTSLYRNQESHNNRSAFHGSSSFDTRLPRVIIDLNRARPVHLAIIDGIGTAEGGAGPWDVAITQIKPGLLLAGKNALAVDAVGTAVMGFNPQALSGESPFMGGENHLELAVNAGFGSTKVSSIQVLGSTIADVMTPFKPAR